VISPPVSAVGQLCVGSCTRRAAREPAASAPALLRRWPNGGLLALRGRQGCEKTLVELQRVTGLVPARVMAQAYCAPKRSLRGHRGHREFVARTLRQRMAGCATQSKA
jgi:hypothetical protein